MFVSPTPLPVKLAVGLPIVRRAASDRQAQKSCREYLCAPGRARRQKLRRALLPEVCGEIADRRQSAALSQAMHRDQSCRSPSMARTPQEQWLKESCNSAENGVALSA